MDDVEIREKVIKGLECCTKKVCIFKDTMKECPYWELCGEYEGAFEDYTSALAKDVLALLKAQEPRVIAAEELEDRSEPAYLEDIFYGGRWALIADFSANWFTFNVTEPGFLKEEEFHVSEYGRRWRCWTSRPTDEQREATPWA